MAVLFYWTLSGNKSDNQSKDLNRTPTNSINIQSSKVEMSSQEFCDLEIPETKPNEEIIVHPGFKLSYNEEHEQANWVAYQLTRAETNAVTTRTDKFIEDPEISTGSATNTDYSRSGYDRGHLAPAADMAWSNESMKASFYFSNMSPQVPAFNRGIWKRTEELARNWAIKYDTLYIVTGPVLKSGLATIGPDRVSVPVYYYKIVFDCKIKNLKAAKAIAFLIPNKGSDEHLQQFVVSIDSIEHLTGINFYPQLPDSMEKPIESNIKIDAWIWNSNSSNER